MQLAELDVFARDAQLTEARCVRIRVPGRVRADFDSCTNAFSGPFGAKTPFLKLEWRRESRLEAFRREAIVDQEL